MGKRGIGRSVSVWVLALTALGLAAGGLVFLWAGDRDAQAMPDCPPELAIIVDPGHGGIDGGTNIPGLTEKEIVLSVALRVKAHLDSAGVPAVMTRDTDVDLGGVNDSGRLRRDLNYRVRVANHCKSALMLSLHVNSASDRSERGMIIFYQPSRPSRDAAFLLDEILRGGGLHSSREQPHPRETFAVLRGPKSPAMLIELGFITNEADRALLTNTAYQERLASALARGCGLIYQKWVK